MARLPRPAIRRPISITTVSALAVVMIVLSLVVAPLLWVIDASTGSRRGRRSRVWLLITATLATEAASVIGAAAIALWYVGRKKSPKRIPTAYALEFWWAEQHLRNLHRFAGIDFISQNPEALAPGNAIIVGRHASHIDAIVPLIALHRVGIQPRYTLKQDLQWAPAMDLIGNRTPNVWIDRAPQPGSPMFNRIESLAAGINDQSTGVIFPEGTFRTPQRHVRAIERLAKTRPKLAEKADALRYVLPPRPAGTLALLKGAPAADVVIMSNVGLEGCASIKEISNTITSDRPVQIHATRYDRNSLPGDDEELVDWFIDRWLEMDEWIHQQLEGQARD